MYIKAIIEDSSGETQTVELENKQSPIPPEGTLDFWRYSASTVNFILKFMRKLKKMLKNGGKIVEIQTDIPFFAMDQLYSQFGAEDVKKIVKVIPKIEE